MSFGFNFRNEISFVTDGANDQGVQITSATALYPQTNTIGGESITWGVTTLTGTECRDRYDTNDVRLAGMWFKANATAGVQIFRVDLPATGTYSINIAAGDPQYASNANTFRILDNTTSKIFVDAVATTSGQFLDATGTPYTNATWPTSNTAVDVTFATTTCFIELGTTTADTAAPSNFSHIHFTAAATASISIDTAPTSVTRGETGLTLTGTEFGATIGTSTLEYGNDTVGWIDISASVTSWSDTTLTFDIASTIALQHDATGYKFKVTVV